MRLAINGGMPICKIEWPRWPIWIPLAEQMIKEVAYSGRWTIRGGWTGIESKEYEFSRQFAMYNGVSYCVATSSGTTGLIISLEALNIGPGDEVIVPSMTWIAPITAVLSVGAIPVLVDIDITTTCIDPLEIKKAITPHTKAIIVVHLHSAVSNLGMIMELVKGKDIFVIEDCSQAHGAIWKNKHVGTVGHVGVFSMNQEKVLTCGEGGAVITNDQYVYDRLFRSKTDGCAFDNNRKDKDEDQLIYENVTMGGNYCMSEFQAAILISQLEKFDTLNSIRRENAGYLDEELSKIEGIMPIRQYEESTKRTVYEYGVRVDNRYFANKDIDIICRALSAELGFRLEKTDIPVYRNKLFDPSTKNRYKFYLEDKRFSQLIPENYPKSELLYNSLIVFHHSVLLAERKDMNLIIGAFRKVRDLATTM